MRTIKYPVYAEIEITDAEYALVTALYNLNEPKKVTAVKFLKEQHNLSLKCAKDICDIIGNHITNNY